MNSISERITKCYYDDIGYCKHGRECKNKHYENICDISFCENNNCLKRHPRECRYFLENSYCKFGSYCKFRHSENIGNKSMNKAFVENINLLKSKIDSLETLIKEKDSKIDNITKILNELKESVMKNVDDLEEMDNPLESIIESEHDCNKEMDEPNESTEVTLSNFPCEECKFVCKSKVGLKPHKKKKHKNIPQLDGFDDFNSSVETQTDYICEKCEFSAETSDMLNNHSSSVHKKYQCWDCDFSCDQRYFMRQHIKSICTG